MDKIIASYVLSNVASVKIIDVNDEQVVYNDACGKKHKAKVYISAKGRAYFKYRSGFRIYLDECMRV